MRTTSRRLKLTQAAGVVAMLAGVAWMGWLIFNAFEIQGVWPFRSAVGLMLGGIILWLVGSVLAWWAA